MKKLSLLLLVGIVLMAGCSLFQKNPFLGTWDMDLSSVSHESGDYYTITFADDTYIDQGQFYSASYTVSGTYEYTDTVLMITERGCATFYLSYVIYDDVMVWEGVLYFYRR